MLPVQKRLTLDQILEHPWVKAGISSFPRRNLNFNRMCEVVTFSKLKSVVASFISSQLPAKEIEQNSDLFKQIDTSNDGYISVTEMEHALK